MGGIECTKEIFILSISIPFEILLKAGIGGLDFDSKIMLDQIRSLDKRRIIRKLGTVNKTILVEACTIAQQLIAAS